MYIRNPETNVWEEVFLPPTGDTLPVGSVSAYGGENIPTNWLKCNGQAVSRADYPELFSVIGTTYGEGDGSTTFNVPDFIGRVPVGLDEEDTDFDTLGETGGEKEHKLTISEMPSHNHTMNAVRQWKSSGDHYWVANQDVNNAIENGTTSNAGGGQAHNNMQPYTVTNFIIKAKQSVGLVGNVVSDINAQGDNDVAPTKVIKEYVDKSIITAYLTTPIITTTDGFIKCQLDSSTSLGNKLTLENGGIRIGKGVKKIKVSGNVTYRYDSGAIDVTGAYIKKNEETIAQSSTYKPDNTKPITASCSPFIVDVVEGDIISLYGYGKSSITTRIVGNQTTRVTFMTVEVVK